MQTLLHLLKAGAILILAFVGALNVQNGWRVLGTRPFRVEGDLGHGLISIDGGYGEIALGVLLLLCAWWLLRRWFLDVPPSIQRRP